MQSKLRYPYLALTLFILAALYIGYVTTQDYGMSWDELGIYDYSNQMLDAYNYIDRPWDFESKVSDHLLNLYGPSHFMMATLLSRVINLLDRSWNFYEAHHLIYFLTFIAGVPVMYLLCSRWMSEWASFGVAVLFSTQPLLWGHAFINPKDTPFMVFFLMSVYFGLQMIDDSSEYSWRKIVLAGVLLGFTTSMRSLGPMAGGFVILYGLWKKPIKTLRIIPVYTVVVLVVTYLTWPYLWGSPVSRYIESLLTMSRHPMEFDVLFMGDTYPANQMPAGYFPALVVFQLTEPMLILFLIGVFVSFKSFLGKGSKEPLLLFLFWFLLPTVSFLIMGSTIYDNSRQLQFLLPPLFVIAGMGLDVILLRIKTPAWRTLLIMMILVPGVYASFRLHPYQYIYYNELIGGVDGAFRKLDLDYWGTSFREVQKYLNSNSEPNTKTYVIVGPRHLSSVYVRSSLKKNLLGPYDIVDSNGSEYYYVLFLTRANADLNICTNGEIVYTIERDGGVLAYVRKIYSKEPCWAEPQG